MEQIGPQHFGYLVDAWIRQEGTRGEETASGRWTKRHEVNRARWLGAMEATESMLWVIIGPEAANHERWIPVLREAWSQWDSSERAPARMARAMVAYCGKHGADVDPEVYAGRRRRHEYSEARERSDLASGDAAERTFYSPGGLSETWHASKRCSGRQGLTRTMSDREAFERLALCRKCCSAILDRHWLPASQRARQASPVHPV